MTVCNWQQDLVAHANNQLVFRCTVCNSQVRICQRVIDSHYGGSIDPVLDAQPPCGTRHVRNKPGISRIMADGPDALNAKLDHIHAAGGTMPPITRRIGNYAKAIARWKAAGSPTRSDVEVLTIFETHCVPCAHYVPAKRSCNLCGCKIRSSGSAFTNKLKMKTEVCPAPTPKWT